AWLNFRLRPPVAQRTVNPDIFCPHWELQTGAYIGAFCKSDQEYVEDYRFDWIQVDGFYSYFFTIPPPLDFKKKFDYFTADAKQDLVVLIEYDIQRIPRSHLEISVPAMET
ncbi:hypothetical protein RSAG8_06897, partial [Rhizoctonia solani AG-8 WAC10335]